MKWEPSHDGVTLVDAGYTHLVSIGRHVDSKPQYYQISYSGNLAFIFSVREINTNYKSLERAKEYVLKRIQNYFEVQVSFIKQLKKESEEE